MVCSKCVQAIRPPGLTVKQGGLADAISRASVALKSAIHHEGINRASMAIEYHPRRGVLIIANFDQGFKVPEMVKQRLCVVISPPIEARAKLCTVVALSTTPPREIQPYHYQFRIPFQMPPRWNNDGQPLWAKCDMIYALGFHRLDLIRLGKDRNGTRQYQRMPLSDIHLRNISNGVLASLGLPGLTD